MLVAISRMATGSEYQAANCEESGFTRGAWQDIIAQEPVIYEQLKSIAKGSGEKGPIIPMTNCWVKWPVNANGEPTRGFRTVILDKVWKNEGVLAHGGIKIFYFFEYGSTREGRECTKATRLRTVKGFTLCRGPDACQELGIPFRASARGSVFLPMAGDGISESEDPRV